MKDNKSTTEEKQGIVNIHGKDYVTVARRVQDAHATEGFDELITEVLNDSPVVIRATVTIKGKKYTGISSVSLQSGKMIEKSNPYEVAETSAVGRALGFAGFGIIEGIASADEIHKSESATVNEVKKDGRSSEQPLDSATQEDKKDFCSIHNKPMKERFRKDGGSWFDHRWQENGDWQKCNGKPKQEEDQGEYYGHEGDGGY